MTHEDPFIIKRWADSHKSLIVELRRRDQKKALQKIVGLQLLPKLAANAGRIEALIHLVLACASGKKQTFRSDMAMWINDVLGRDRLARLEDPPEDVFVSNVVTGEGNRRIFEGIWETNDFLTQLCFQTYDLVAQRERRPELALKTYPLLLISEMLAERAALPCCVPAGGQDKVTIPLPNDAELSRLGSLCEFTWAALESAGIYRSQLSSFLLTPADLANLPNHSLLNESPVHSKPLFEIENGVLVLIPSSLPVAMRKRMIDLVIENSLQESFHDALQRQQWGGIEMAFRRMGASRLDGTREITEIPHLESVSGSSRLFQFDRDWYALVVLLSPGSQQLQEATSDTPIFISASDALKMAEWETSVTKAIENVTGFRGGLLCTVMSSLGSGLGGAFPAPAQWNVWPTLGLSLANLVTLSRAKDMDLIRLRNILQTAAQLREQRVEMINPNGDFNYIAYLVQNGFRPIPSGASDRNSTIQLRTDYINRFRTEIRQNYNERGIPIRIPMQTTRGETEVTAVVVAERFHSFSEFPREGLADCYVCVADAQSGRLRAAIEHCGAVWWIELPRPQMKESSPLFFHLWNAVVLWFERLLPLVIDSDDGALPNLLTIQINPEEPFVVDSVATFTADSLRVVAVTEMRIEIAFPRGFAAEFFSPQNSGERRMMEEVFNGIAEAFSAEAVSLQLSEILEKAFRDRGARSMHFGTRFDVRSKIQHMTGRRKPIRAAQENIRSAQLGLAFSIDSKAVPGMLLGVKAKMFLNAAVACVRSMLKDRLQKLDVQELLVLLLENIEQIEADNWQWRVSARALIGLHGSVDEVTPIVAKHASDNARSTLASAVVIEMANCDCPRSGGLRPTETDIRMLLGLTALLIEMGYHSDALHCGLTDAAVVIFPSGEIENQKDFWSEVMVPYQSGVFKTGFSRAANDYERIVAPAPDSGSAKQDPRFDDAIRAETGLSLQDCWLLIEAMGDLACQNKRAVIRLDVETTSRDLAGLTGLDQVRVRQFIESLSLHRRPDYEQPPTGHVASDIHAWRFSRRLSFVRRPIVRPDDGPNGRLICSPGAIEHSFGHFVHKFRHGEYDRGFFDSPEAKRWIDYATKALSLEFEKRVAAVFENKGYAVFHGLPMKRLGATSADELGEIDVLSFDHDSGICWVIECKNFREARTVKEIAEQLNKCKGEHRDALHQHIRRMEWINRHPECLLRLTATTSWKVEDRMVTNTLVPMRFKGNRQYPVEHWIDYGSLDLAISGGQSTIEYPD